MSGHRPFLGIAVFFGLGIWAQDIVRFPFGPGWVLTAGLFLLSFIFRKRRIFLWGLFLAFFFLGMIYSRAYQKFPSDHIVYAASKKGKQEIAVEGLIVSDVKRKDSFKGTKVSFELEVRRLQMPYGWKNVSGKVLVNLYRDMSLSYGDYISLNGKLFRPYNFSKGEKFSYPKYLRRKGIYRILSVKKDLPVVVLERGKGRSWKAKMIFLRNRCKKIFYTYLTPPEAAFMTGLVVGDRSGIPEAINQLFLKTGTVHVLAISGLHVTLVAGVLFFFLKMIPVPRIFQYVLAVILLIVYTLLTGAAPSIVRAAIMSTVFLLSFLTERESDGMNSLSIAALLIFLLNPLALFDVGFQLSFMSVFGIFVFYALFLHQMSRLSKNSSRQPLRFLFQSMAVSLAAWLAVVGMLAYYFEIVTPVSILANIFIVPLTSFLVVLGFGLLVLGQGVPFLAGILAVTIKLILNITVALTYYFAQIPGAYFFLKGVTLWQVGIFYALFGILVFLVKDRQPPLADGLQLPDDDSSAPVIDKDK